MASDKDDKGPEKRSSVLAQLKCPLVFFGLALLVVESTFGGVLISSAHSERTTIIIASLMGGLFVLSMLTVGFLVYKVPINLMLLAHNYVQYVSQRTHEFDAVKEQIEQLAQSLRTLSENLPDDAEEIKRSLREISERLQE